MQNVPSFSHSCLLFKKLKCLVSLFSQGKRNSGFRQCFFGSQKHCKLTKLCPAMGYTFRLAARNDIGTRYDVSLFSSAWWFWVSSSRTGRHRSARWLHTEPIWAFSRGNLNQRVEAPSEVKMLLCGLIAVLQAVMQRPRWGALRTQVEVIVQIVKGILLGVCCCCWGHVHFLPL